MRTKTKNIKKCLAQMCIGKPKNTHVFIKSKYIVSRDHKKPQGKK